MQHETSMRRGAVMARQAHGRAKLTVEDQPSIRRRSLAATKTPKSVPRDGSDGTWTSPTIRASSEDSIPTVGERRLRMITCRCFNNLRGRGARGCDLRLRCGASKVHCSGFGRTCRKGCVKGKIFYMAMIR